MEYVIRYHANDNFTAAQLRWIRVRDFFSGVRIKALAELGFILSILGLTAVIIFGGWRVGVGLSNIFAHASYGWGMLDLLVGASMLYAVYRYFRDACEW